MAVTYRAQVSMWGDSTLPRDAMVITPHFHDDGVLSDPQNLADDLADAIAGWTNAARQIVVKLYDARQPPPQFPKATAERNLGVAPASGAPREIAVCLSYFAEFNRRRRRGRLYVPFVCAISGAASGARPLLGVRQKAADLVPIFANLGGVDVDWVLYSRVDDAHHTVTNWWVDDEWDTVRSRGLRPTTRTEGTTGG